jgi:hypothetical protein
MELVEVPDGDRPGRDYPAHGWDLCGPALAAIGHYQFGLKEHAQLQGADLDADLLGTVRGGGEGDRLGLTDRRGVRGDQHIVHTDSDQQGFSPRPAENAGPDQNQILALYSWINFRPPQVTPRKTCNVSMDCPSQDCKRCRTIENRACHSEFRGLVRKTRADLP